MLAARLPWAQLETAIAAKFASRVRVGAVVETDDLFGRTQTLVGAGVSAAGRPRLPPRLMISLLYLEHTFNLNDEELVVRWSENVLWQFFGGRKYFEPGFSIRTRDDGEAIFRADLPARDKPIASTMGAKREGKDAKSARQGSCRP